MMANDRPSTRPGGYWIAGAPTSIPAHTYPRWLLDLLGQQYQGSPDEFVPPDNALQDPANFLVPPGGDNARKRKLRNPLNVLSMLGRY
jgi:hypothetical protein